jgi:RNA polymerase sigma factor FliA
MGAPSPEVPTCDELVRQHLPLVGYAVAELASRIPRHVNRDDLVSAGMLGLVQAAKTFNTERGVDFAVHAKRRIRGALLDELRSRDWATRSVREFARRADAASEQLAGTLGRTPTQIEVAARLGIEPAEIAQLAADVERATVVHYEAIVLGDDADAALPVHGTDPEAHLLARERCNYLYDAVATLPERMRHVVTASFFEDRTLAEIAADLGVGESRVSQIRSDALALLRDGMNANLEPSAVTDPGDGVVAKRKAAYFEAVAGASDFRGRIAGGSDDIAERVALSGL